MIVKLPLHSLDIVSENVQRIANLFPNCITEAANGKAIDFDLLKQELSGDIVDGLKERYRLEWPGKREAIVTANLPTNKTLRPIREDSVNFDNTENLYIEGDNLEVLKLLQESYLDKIKMIYIDPPYNTGNDFVYKDNFTQDKAEFEQENAIKDEYNQRLQANPNTSGRYHSDWLTMIYPRLKLARNLLTDDGIIFISIDDNEVHNLRKVCDEIFGEENIVGNFVWQSKKGGGSDSKTIVNDHEYILCVSKKISEIQVESIEIQSEPLDKFDDKGKYRRGRELNKWGSNSRRSDRPTMWFPIKGPNHENVYPIRNDGEEGCWRYGKKNMEGFVKEDNVEFVIRENGTYIAYEKIRTTDPRYKPFRTWLNDVSATSEGSIEVRELFDGKKIFDFPKPLSVLKKCISIGTTLDDIILDFFSGSSATADAVMKLNAEDSGYRKFIMVQVPEVTDEKSEAFKAGYKNICEIGKERIRKAGKKIQEEWHKANEEKEVEIAFKENEKRTLDIGFRVYRLDSSNMQDVYYKPQEYKQENINLFASNIKPDRTSEDLLAQIMLSWCLPLHYKIEVLDIQNKQVFKVEQDSLFACFDSGIDEAFAKEIATYKPMRIIFKDDSFKDDTAKENVKQLLKQLSPNTEMKVI